MTDQVAGHVQTRRLIETVWYPTHDPRRASAEYERVHHHLVYELDEPCWICGVRQSTLPKAQHMETHHWALEWALANAVDPKLVAPDFEPDRIVAANADDAWLRQWLDSEANLWVLCANHHRGGLHGVHMVTMPAWIAQRYERSHDVTQAPK